VDDLWFAHATPGDVLGIPVRLCPPEEMIWSKAFIMERERYDGADSPTDPGVRQAIWTGAACRGASDGAGACS
jgi:hypothetical protein